MMHKTPIQQLRQSHPEQKKVDRASSIILRRTGEQQDAVLNMMYVYANSSRTAEVLQMLAAFEPTLQAMADNGQFLEEEIRIWQKLCGPDSDPWPEANRMSRLDA